MMFNKNNSVEAGEQELEQALQNFRASVQAWSEAEYGRSRPLVQMSMHHTWKRAVAWALGCVLAVGGLSLGMYERHNQQDLAKNGAVHQRQQQHPAVTVQVSPAPAVESSVEKVVQSTARQMDENESLMAAVDSDVSQQVPSAMKPLAQLMDNNSNQ